MAKKKHEEKKSDIEGLKAEYEKKLTDVQTQLVDNESKR